MNNRTLKLYFNLGLIATALFLSTCSGGAIPPESNEATLSPPPLGTRMA